MKFKGNCQQGTASLGEYILIFALVIAAVSTMAAYVQRGVQAAMRDGRHYVATNVRAECASTNCVGDGDLGEHYEPYYLQSNATVETSSLKHTGLIASGLGTSGTFVSRVSSNNENNLTSAQLPPKEAANDQVLGKR